MTQDRVVLVTGVAGYWGSRVAARLATLAGHHVIGLDVERPDMEIQGLHFVRADIHNPLLVDLLKAEGIDTVCHLAFVETARRSEAAFEANVMGTTKLFGACTNAGVHKVVFRSSTAVYGARPSNSSFLTEDHSLRGSRHYGYTRDMVEIEALCNALCQQMPDVIPTILRFASIIGPTADTPMTRFLGNPWTPSLLGFDPMMQFIHEDDVVAALVHSVLHDVPGVFNVAARDVLPLNKVRGLARKPPVPVLHLFAYWGERLRGNRLLRIGRYLPMDPDYLRYPWVGDLTRMRDELNFDPRYTAEEALHAFAERNRTGHPPSDSEGLARDEEQLLDIIEQRRGSEERQAATTTSVEKGGEDE
ncbi:NAD-dependent epimerase/dehydratase family protein [Chloroflexota bacterium]